MAKIIISDTHFGDQHDSDQHNQDLLDFGEHIVNYAKNLGITDLIHTGDFFDNWKKIGLNTECYALEFIKLLKTQFKDIKLIKGNHDLYLHDSREISSVEMFRHEVDLIDHWKLDEKEKILYTSWICNDNEYRQVVELSKKADYAFGHFEFKSFQMNDHYVMEGGRSHLDFSHLKQLFTGHYHLRQTKGNVTYVGSPFPMDFNDANDSSRGFIVFEPKTGEWEWIDYTKIAILSIPYREFMTSSYAIDNPDTKIRVVVDEVLSDEETTALQTKIEGMMLRSSQVNYTTNRIKEAIKEEGKKVSDIKNLDELVIENIASMSELDEIDKPFMIELYRKAMQMESIE